MKSKNVDLVCRVTARFSGLEAFTDQAGMTMADGLSAFTNNTSEIFAMIVHHIDDLKNTDRHVSTSEYQSTRMIVRSEAMGYSVHHTIVYEGTEIPCHYEYHLETNYCVAGEGEVHDVAKGTTYQIRIGSVYALDKHDKHILRATRGDLHLICVFNPALEGNETPNAEDGFGNN